MKQLPDSNRHPSIRQANRLATISSTLANTVCSCFFFVGITLAFVSPSRAGDQLETIKNCNFVPTEWADGDSFLVQKPDGGQFTARLYGADCLEWHVTDATDERRLRAQRRYFGITEAEPDAKRSIEIAKTFGAEAAKYVASALSKPFTIHTAWANALGDGKHERFYVFINTADGKDLASELVKLGFARAFGVHRQTPDGRSKDEYKAHLGDLEFLAASTRKGIWAKTDWEKFPAERRAQRLDDEQVAIAIGNAGLAPDEKINPNTAARDELMRLPGIGEKLANRIIEIRPFKKADDLLTVPGIGKEKFEQILPHLSFPKP